MKRGMRLYAELLGAVHLGNMTGKEISERTGLRAQCVRQAMRHMVWLELVHIAGFDHTGRGTPQAIFAYGRGVNAEMPISKRTGKQCNGQWTKRVQPKPRSELITFKAICEAMGPGATKTEIINESGATWNSVVGVIKEMRRVKVAHICGWVSSGHGYPAAIFALGRGNDAKRPKPESKQALSLKYYYKRKAANQANQIAAAFSIALEAA